MAESCGNTLLVQADFDGELDAAQAAALAAHRQSCAACQAAYAELQAVRQAFRTEASYHRAPAELRSALAARLAAASPAPARPRRWRLPSWRPAAGFGLGAAFAAALMLLVLPQGQQDLVQQVVAGHVRALQPGHLEDVVSTDKHTVKPWFDGKLDFAPPVKDLVDKGFPLLGGRLDYLDGRPVAALAYASAKHPIDLFVWPERGGDAEPSVAEYNGYNVVHWSQGGMTLWAVSDLERPMLETFVRDWRALP